MENIEELKSKYNMEKLHKKQLVYEKGKRKNYKINWKD